MEGQDLDGDERSPPGYVITAFHNIYVKNIMLFFI